MATAVAGLLIPLSSWFYSVQKTVLDPYLVRSHAINVLQDEVFHVRQAQHYCVGRFHIWDPKITTPPGLYLLSSLLAPFLGCDASVLRALSSLCLCVLAFVVARTYPVRHPRSPLAQHNALNVVLFPPLFFFTALYYTDVASTLSVLLFYLFFLRSYQDGRPTLSQQSALVFLGLASLLFRQTNIFWVAVFPAGLVLIYELDQGHDAVKHSMHRGSQGFGDSLYSVAKTSWKMDVVYSPAVRSAWLEDYSRTILSILVCTSKIIIEPTRIFALLSALAPYITLITAFAGFIFVNGSVVLGDKTNHVATLHLSQMLYLWPYMAFFSWPLLLPYLLLVPLTLYAKFPKTPVPEIMLIFRRQDLLPRLGVTALCTGIAIAIVHFNTVVHPFTLADNRHYTFYVFRLLLRPGYTRYLVTPIYVFCGWATIETLGNGSANLLTPPAPTPTSSSSRDKARPAPRALPVPNGVHADSLSFVLVWLTTTALQLITAPLVEPRYFILPWLFWRIHLPLSSLDDHDERAPPARRTLDARLCLETAWLLLVNAVTGYIFLAWGFSWPQEPGAVQRFMW